jgi:hypothetical protein
MSSSRDRRTEIERIMGSKCNEVFENDPKYIRYYTLSNGLCLIIPINISYPNKSIKSIDSTVYLLNF